MNLILSKWKALLGAVFVAALVGLSFFSDYSVESVGDMNLEIATMLTPVGLVRNLLVESSHYLRPYYFHEIQGRSSMFDNMGTAGCALALVISSLIVLVKLRKALGGENGEAT